MKIERMMQTFPTGCNSMSYYLQVLSAAQSRRNKTQILMGALFKRKWTEDELFLKVDSVSSEALAAYQIYKSSIDRTSQGSSLCRARKFVAPGKIVFLRPHKEKIGESEHTNRTFQVSNVVGVPGSYLAHLCRMRHT